MSYVISKKIGFIFSFMIAIKTSHIIYIEI